MKNLFQLVFLLFIFQVTTQSIIAGDSQCWEDMFRERSMQRASESTDRVRAGALILKVLSGEESRSTPNDSNFLQRLGSLNRKMAELEAKQSSKPSFLDHRWPTIRTDEPSNSRKKYFDETTRYTCGLIRKMNANGSKSAEEALAKLPTFVVEDHVLNKCPLLFQQEHERSDKPSYFNDTSFLQTVDTLNREIAELEVKLGRS